jgi:hypothetical protein
MSNPIDVQLLRDLRDVHTGMHWLQNLARAQVRRSAGGPSEQVYTLAAQIDALDEKIRETYALDKFFYRLPEGWWIWVPLVYLGAFLYAAQRDSYEERLMYWMWSLMIFGGIALTFLARKVAKESGLRREKVRRRPRLKGERAALMVQLMETRDHLVENAQSLVPQLL